MTIEDNKCHARTCSYVQRCRGARPRETVFHDETKIHEDTKPTLYIVSSCPSWTFVFRDNPYRARYAD